MKNKWLSFLSIPALAVGIIPTTLTGCSKKPVDVDVLQQLEDDTIKEFKAMAYMPRPSDLFLYEVPYQSNCSTFSLYLKKRVKELTGIDANQDKYANLWFDVPCNDDKYKDCPTIALQCHMDMVFAYNPDKFEYEPDPLKTPIELVDEIKDGKRLIHSKDYKTSIGGDNAIGIAGILALISNNNVKHGNLRIIFTNCEENAMQGAMMLVDGHRNDSGEIIQPATAPNIMNGVKYVINLDTGINKSVCVSGSGAVGSHYRQTYEAITEPTLPYLVQLNVSGFKGGHSAGVPRQGYGNALKAANEVLYRIGEANHIELMSYSTPGTTAYNNVPSNCVIEFATDVPVNQINDLVILEVRKTHTNKSDLNNYWLDMEGATMVATDKFTPVTNYCVDQTNSLNMVQLNYKLWYGFRHDVWELHHMKVSANVGPSSLKYENGVFNFESSSYSRSDFDTDIDWFKQENLKLAHDYGFNYLCDAQFHPWVRDESTKLLNLTKEAIANTLNCTTDEVEESEAHGGLECTWWAYAMKNIEHINDGASTCLGINVIDEHKFTEAVDVASIKDCMKTVIYIFNNYQKLL